VKPSHAVLMGASGVVLNILPRATRDSSLGEQPMRNDVSRSDRPVTPSELKNFAFCQRAWFLERQGGQSTLIVERARGREDHESHGVAVRQAQRGSRAGAFLFALGLVGIPSAMNATNREAEAIMSEVFKATIFRLKEAEQPTTYRWEATTVTLRELAEAIGAALKLPVRSVTREEAEAKWGPFLTAFVPFENRASKRKAVEQLGWQPKGIDMLTDIRSGSYRDLAKRLRQG
jgi:hypothetical protein